jgi:hypothetical protein
MFWDFGRLDQVELEGVAMVDDKGLVQPLPTKAYLALDQCIRKSKGQTLGPTSFPREHRTAFFWLSTLLAIQGQPSLLKKFGKVGVPTGGKTLIKTAVKPSGDDRKVKTFRHDVDTAMATLTEIAKSQAKAASEAVASANQALIDELRAERELMRSWIKENAPRELQPELVASPPAVISAIPAEVPVFDFQAWQKTEIESTDSCDSEDEGEFFKVVTEYGSDWCLVPWGSVKSFLVDTAPPDEESNWRVIRPYEHDPAYALITYRPVRVPLGGTLLESADMLTLRATEETPVPDKIEEILSPDLSVGKKETGGQSSKSKGKAPEKPKTPALDNQAGGKSGSKAADGKKKEEPTKVENLPNPSSPPKLSLEQEDALRNFLKLEKRLSPEEWKQLDKAAAKEYRKKSALPAWARNAVAADPANLGLIISGKLTADSSKKVGAGQRKAAAKPAGGCGAEWALIKSRYPGVTLWARPQSAKEKSLAKEVSELKVKYPDDPALPRPKERNNSEERGRGRASSRGPGGDEILLGIRAIGSIFAAFSGK